VLKQGAFFGELSLMRGDPRSATIVAGSHQNLHVFLLSPAAMEQALHLYPSHRTRLRDKCAEYLDLYSEREKLMGGIRELTTRNSAAGVNKRARHQRRHSSKQMV
jgi:CRP-like cAMP-binding protein